MPEPSVVFTLAGVRLRLPVKKVELITVPPAVTPVPHAPATLLGAGQVGGQIVPIVDPAPLLHSLQAWRRYDGSGQIVRVRSDGGRFGIWVDKVEAVTGGAQTPGGPDADAADLAADAPLLDIGGLAATGLTPPALGLAAGKAEAESAIPAPPASRTAAVGSYFVFEVAGRRFELAAEHVQQLVETVAWTRFPRAPRGIRGVAVLRGAALPIVSLAMLLGLPEAGEGGRFVVVAIDGHPLLLAVDRVLGLRVHRRGNGDRSSEEGRSAGEGELHDLAEAMPDEIRRIVGGFAASAAATDEPTQQNGAQYLAISLAGEQFAVPITAVERVVGPRPIFALPQAPDAAIDGAPPIAGAIEFFGRIVPVLTLEGRLGLRTGAAAPGAFMIVRGSCAIAVDRIVRLVSLRPEEITPQPDENSILTGLAAPGGGPDLLPILAPGRLWADR
jgi:purine-binding chemotaxis protein CheW